MEHADTDAMVDIHGKLAQTIIFDMLAKKDIQEVKSELFNRQICAIFLIWEAAPGMGPAGHLLRGVFTGDNPESHGRQQEGAEGRVWPRAEGESAEEACLGPLGA